MNHVNDPYDRPIDHRGVEPVRPARGGGALGIVALVLGLLALLTSWIPGLGIIAAIILGLAAIILGLMARSRARRTGGSGRGSGVAGAILGLLALVVAALVTWGVVSLFGSSNLDECLSDAGTDTATAEQCLRDYADEATDTTG